MAATLSQIQAWSTQHLTDAATYWTQTADKWEDAFLTMRNQSHSIAWQGAGGDALRQRTAADLSTVTGKADLLRQAAGIARSGASDISTAQRSVLNAVADAQNAGFDVGEDLSVSYNDHGGTPAQQAARQAQAEQMASQIWSRAKQLDGTETKVAGQLTAATAGLGNTTFTPARDGSGIQLVDNETSAKPHEGQLPDPSNPLVGDQRFGHWENVPPPPPYTGPKPPPLKPEYRPFPDGTPQKVGPTTGMYTPGQSWIGDVDPPAVQGQEEYRFKLAGEQATTVTRNVYENGQLQTQRWVENVYQYQRNTSMVFGGDVGMKGIEGEAGDIGGLPPIQNIDTKWKPISLPQIASLSGNNAGTTYYLPDGCGGTVKFVGGIPSGSSGLPFTGPIMTAPR